MNATVARMTLPTVARFHGEASMSASGTRRIALAACDGRIKLKRSATRCGRASTIRPEAGSQISTI